MQSFDTTDFRPDLPDLDDRLVEPESGYEMYDGELVAVSPADPPHAERQVKLGALVMAHLDPAFRGAADMLTRTSKTSDIAPDVSVFPRARHPVTGKRQLEHLAFEVVSTQTLRHAARKAGMLSERGVRRVFAIDVERGRALEWSRELGTWAILDAAAWIEDPVFATPLPIASMLNEDVADDPVADALIAKRNPKIEAVRTQGRAEGQVAALLAVLGARGLVPTRSQRVRLQAERDAARLVRWIVRAATCVGVADVLATP